MPAPTMAPTPMNAACRTVSFLDVRPFTAMPVIASFAAASANDP